MMKLKALLLLGVVGAFRPAARFSSPPVSRRAESGASDSIPPRERFRAFIEATARDIAAETGDLLIDEVAWIDEGATLRVVIDGMSGSPSSEAGDILIRKLNDVVDDEATADESGVAFVPPYTLEVGSRGISNELTRDADYVVYKGFQVTLTTSSEFKGRTVFDDVSLHGRDEKAVTLNSKGRLIAVPRELVESVCLKQLDLEDGDEIPT